MTAAARADALVVRRSDCRLCGNRDLERVFSLVPTPLADAYLPASRHGELQPVYPLDLYLCRRCGLAQLLDVVIPQAIYVDYLYETRSSLGLTEHFHDYAREVVALLNPSPGALAVDIGSNDGTLLSAFAQRGLRVLGIEPARAIAARATAKGIETVSEFFTPELSRTIRAHYGPATVIAANNLFANVDDLASFTEGVRTLLAPDGVFVIESFYVVDWLQRMVFDFMYHEHLSYLSVGPLDAFFRRQGMELVDAIRIPTKGGSVRYVAQRAGGPRSRSAAVGALADLEARAGVHGPEAFRGYARQILGIKRQVHEMLKPFVTQGRLLGGYGASATSTSLIYHFDLGDRLAFIADDNPQRQGTLSPGHHIPVVPPDALYDRGTDAVLLLAWRYADAIIAKHQRFLQDGGRFIVPLPVPQLFSSSTDASGQERVGGARRVARR